METKEFFYIDPSTTLFRNGIHSLLRLADARANADII